MPYEIPAGAFEAYTQGRMDPADVQQLEADLASGEAIAPSSKIEMPSPSAKVMNEGQYEVPEGAFEAYQNKTMDPEHVKLLEADIDAGKAIIPTSPENPEKPENLVIDRQSARHGGRMPPEQGQEPQSAQISINRAQARHGGQLPPEQVQVSIDRAQARHGGQVPIDQRGETIFEKGVVDAQELMSGNKRSTPFIESTKDWTELDLPGFGKDTMAFMATLSTGPKETMDIMAANLGQGAKVEYDENNNPYIVDPRDGQVYGYKPGFRKSDIPRLVGAVGKELALGAALGPLGQAKYIGKFIKPISEGKNLFSAGTREAALEGVTQLGEGVMGGSTDGIDIVGAGVGGSLLRTGGGITQGAFDGIKADKIIKNAQTDVAGMQELLEMNRLFPEKTKIMLEANRLKLDPNGKLTKFHRSNHEILKDISNKKAGAVEELADKLSIDKNKLDAARETGTLEDLTMRELVDRGDKDAWRVVSALDKSELTTVMEENLQDVSSKLVGLGKKVGGDSDLTGPSEQIRESMKSIMGRQKAEINQAYEELGDLLPKGKIGVEANETISYLEKKIDDLTPENPLPNEPSGSALLEPFERKVYNYLKNKIDEVETGVVGPDGKMITREVVSEPTYARLNQLIRKAGEKTDPKNIVRDADYHEANTLYGKMSNDRDALIDKYGGEDLKQIHKEAKGKVVAQKAYEQEAMTIFGKKMDKDLADFLNPAIGGVARSSPENFIRTVKAVPQKFRQGLVTSAFMKNMDLDSGNINFAKLSKFYSKIKDNSKFMAFISDKQNIPEETLKTVKALGEVAIAIDSSKNRLVSQDLAPLVLPKENLTRKIVDTLEKFALTGSSMSIYNKVMKTAGGGGSGGGSGLAASSTAGAIMNASEKTKLNTVLDVLTSPEFKAMMIAPKTTPDQVRKLSRTDKMRAWARLNEQSTKPSDIENMINLALRTEPSEDE